MNNDIYENALENGKDDIKFIDAEGLLDYLK